MDDMLKGYTIKLEHDQRCNGCGIMLGPHTPQKAGIFVKEGPVTGMFHNSECYNQTREEVEKPE